MKTSIYKLLTLIALLITSLPTFAQDGFDNFGGDVPVDGGLTLLAAAGVGYGAKKLKEKRKS
jgi:hypothetical protein